MGRSSAPTAAWEKPGAQYPHEETQGPVRPKGSDGRPDQELGKAHGRQAGPDRMDTEPLGGAAAGLIGSVQ